MRGRDPAEAHRAATPLELFFDLCFVVAVAQAAAAMHHDLAAGHLAEGVVKYLIVFFAIWWAWMNFTWFASAFDTDDVLYRLLTFVQMAGALVIASGVPRAFAELDLTVMTVGYLIMRIGLVAQWLRAAIEHPEVRVTALRFAAGLVAVQTLWVLRLALPFEIGVLAIMPLVIVDLSVPVWAESSGHPTPWHPAHIAERYGLFTIIVLGESVLAASLAFQDALGAGGLSPSLLALAVGAMILLFAMWWAYFKHHPADDDLRHSPFVWGYGQYFVFASAAAVGAGLQVAAESTHHELGIGPIATALTVAGPVAVYLAAAWLVSGSGRRWRVFRPVAVGIVLVLGASLVAGPVDVAVATLAMGLVVAAVVGWTAYRWSGHAVATEPAVAPPAGSPPTG